ncbi:ArsR family transcriptional regulator [Chitinophaga niastensis]|uniref:ArsR family transcriptional regulator n=1 Tax=Chitinophaga niastensis TaxID=536980 RepID=A0A2P8HJG0_CHINA|nr:winged helix-turn-helix domain-containing protein [Chitinophaga niastensis]PSL46364.1 ArsR family transcriptional regulator [Chitinophaga niastensis]
METQIGHIASLIGDPVRALILWTLLDDKAYTATELAISANTSPQNISMHLSKLVQADLLTVERQGRHAYYRFSKQEVAYAIEAIANLVPVEQQKKIVHSKHNAAIKHCRTCYDHLAGNMGVSIADSLLKQAVIIEKGKQFELTTKGAKWFLQLGIDTKELQQQRRIFLKPCLDWTERRYHIAGSLGASLLDTMLAADWVRRTKNSRAIVITAAGEKKMREYFR